MTQNDVATKAGVHVSTVSLALRNHPSLPEATRERIRILANEMGYRPDPNLGALVQYRRAHAQRSTSTIAYVTRWDTRYGWKSDPPHAEFFAGATVRAEELGYQLEHFWLGEPDLTHRRLSDMLSARGIHGIIVASHLYEIDANLAFDWSQFAGVKIDCIPHQPALHSVSNNQRSIIQLAMRETLAAGYNRVGFVLDRRWDVGVDRAWTAGFLAEQQTLDEADQIPMFLFPDCALGGIPRANSENEQVPLERFARWLKQYQPEVIISNRRFVERGLKLLGYSVPHDIGYVDILLGDTDGSVAGVRQNCDRVGELAVEILAGKLQQHIYGIPKHPTATLVEGTWFPGVTLPVRSVEPYSLTDHPLPAAGA